MQAWFQNTKSMLKKFNFYVTFMMIYIMDMIPEYQEAAEDSL